MSVSALNPKATLAIFLGASAYPKAPKLADGSSFYQSAFDFKEYVTNPSIGLGLPKAHVAWFFDDTRYPAEQLEDIGEFLSRFTDVENLLIYYVGHGLFTRVDRSYCLAVRATNVSNEGPTSIRAAELAHVLKEHVPFGRRFLILDCCFSSAIYKEFQSAPLQLVSQQIGEELPEKGTALLCSSSAVDVSLAPESGQYTMFSGALLQVLKDGHAGLGPLLSLEEVGILIRQQLKKAYPDDWVRPQVLSPDQRSGDISTLPLFPNQSFGVANTNSISLNPAKSSQDKTPSSEAVRYAIEPPAKSDSDESVRFVFPKQLWFAFLKWVLPGSLSLLSLAIVMMLILHYWSSPKRGSSAPTAIATPQSTPPTPSPTPANESSTTEKKNKPVVGSPGKHPSNYDDLVQRSGSSQPEKTVIQMPKQNHEGSCPDADYTLPKEDGAWHFQFSSTFIRVTKDANCHGTYTPAINAPDLWSGELTCRGVTVKSTLNIADCHVLKTNKDGYSFTRN